MMTSRASQELNLMFSTKFQYFYGYLYIPRKIWALVLILLNQFKFQCLPSTCLRCREKELKVSSFSHERKIKI